MKDLHSLLLTIWCLVILNSRRVRSGSVSEESGGDRYKVEGKVIVQGVKLSGECVLYKLNLNRISGKVRIHLVSDILHVRVYVDRGLCLNKINNLLLFMCPRCSDLRRFLKRMIERLKKKYYSNLPL